MKKDFISPVIKVFEYYEDVIMTSSSSTDFDLLDDSNELNSFI